MINVQLVVFEHLAKLCVSQDCIMSVVRIYIINQQLNDFVEALAGPEQPQRANMDAALGALITHSDLVCYALVTIPMKTHPDRVRVFQRVVANRAAKNLLE